VLSPFSLFSLFSKKSTAREALSAAEILELKGSADEITADTFRCFSLFPGK
jgi:hypothetical protein